MPGRHRLIGYLKNQLRIKTFLIGTPAFTDRKNFFWVELRRLRIEKTFFRVELRRLRVEKTFFWIELRRLWVEKTFFWIEL
jgi:hypothetical protein